MHYEGTRIFRAIDKFMAQGGDVINDNGSGGECIIDVADDFENREFKDEKKFEPYRKGDLMMANHGDNTNASQFIITFVKTDKWLKGKHVVFGQVDRTVYDSRYVLDMLL